MWLCSSVNSVCSIARPTHQLSLNPVKSIPVSGSTGSSPVGSIGASRRCAPGLSMPWPHRSRNGATNPTSGCFRSHRPGSRSSRRCGSGRSVTVISAIQPSPGSESRSSGASNVVHEPVVTMTTEGEASKSKSGGGLNWSGVINSRSRRVVGDEQVGGAATIPATFRRTSAGRPMVGKLEMPRCRRSTAWWCNAGIQIGGISWRSSASFAP